MIGNHLVVVNGIPIDLTPREQDLIAALFRTDIDGSAQIAEALHISVGTVKVYLSRLYDKLGFPSGSQRLVVLWVMQNAPELVPTNIAVRSAQ